MDGLSLCTGYGGLDLATEEGWVTDLIPNRRALKVLGNGVVPQQAALAIRGLL